MTNCLNCEDEEGGICFECKLMHQSGLNTNKGNTITHTQHTTLHKDADNFFFFRRNEYKAMYESGIWEIWKWCDENNEFFHFKDIEDNSILISSIQLDL